MARFGMSTIYLDTDSYGYEIDWPSGIQQMVSEKHTRHLKLSDGREYAVELEIKTGKTASWL